MIKSLIRKLFLNNEKRNEIIKDLKSNPNFRTKEEIEKHGTDSIKSDFKLEKGEVQSVCLPELGNQKGFTLTKWYVKQGDIVKKGDIVCEIENENITMEFESFYRGKIISTCRINQKLTSGIEIFKIEGI
ncbi:biotin/lipoyl-containing protein [Cytophaga sp. FL35]|uniref:biotin/lipoyl-containing protein n=1 Tax=Cytophaga sp. FL35 TaxID=1904456 RepID=UPI00165385CC|nr:biotin/lipoyl-containing protein [Cytophaga sp. FL35]MBC7000552.1 biotin/lipoyl-binding protein [Cytophaga sp. FL35]